VRIASLRILKKLTIIDSCINVCIFQLVSFDGRNSKQSGSGSNLWFIVLSTDAFRTSFIQHIQHRFHDAGQVKDGAGTHPDYSFNQ